MARDPNKLTIEVVERVSQYDPALRIQWRDPGWWDAEGWKDFLPEREWHRAQSKFRTQAIQSGFYFVEVLHMRALEAQDLSWRFEGYDFFEPPNATAAHTRKGYALVEAAFGAKKLHRIQAAASNYRLGYGYLAATPDLFVFRLKGTRVSPLAFVEIKQDDPLKPKQLLGLALIQDILEAPVEVVRYVPQGTVTAVKPHRGTWPRRGFIPEA
jgi:hypothetical protein